MDSMRCDILNIIHKNQHYQKISQCQNLDIFQQNSLQILLVMILSLSILSFLQLFPIEVEFKLKLAKYSIAIINQFAFQQVAMTTPLQLKRRTPFTESTIDRTFKISKSKDHLKDIIPCFISSSKESYKYEGKQSSYQQIKRVQFSKTDELQQKVNQNIVSDDQKSEYTVRNDQRNKFYKDCSARMKVAKGAPWSIPLKVTELYANQESKHSGRINFAHGCLGKSAIYYFAVENRVLFYDITAAIRLNKKLEDCFMQAIQFQFPVFQLKEIEWRLNLSKQLKNKNVMLVSSPWSIKFSVLQVAQSSFKQQENVNRWMKVTMLNYHFSIPCIRAYCITEGNQQIFYVDESGTVNKLSVEPNDFWGKIFNGKKTRLTSESIKHPLSKNYFYVTKKSTLLEKIRHYSKVMFSEIKSLFKTTPSIYGLVFDKKRKLLFSLIDNHHQKQSKENANLYSYSKLLSCWQINQGRLSLRCQISELELLAGSSNDQIFTHNIGKNNKISKIMKVQECYYPNSCLLVVLNNGVRLYMKILEESFQISSYEFPPSFEFRQRYNERKCVQYNKNVDLLHFDSKGSINVLTIKQEETNHTFYIWKDHQLKQHESVCHISWKQSLYQGDIGQSPIQNFFFTSQLGLVSKKKALLTHLLEKKTKRPFSNSENISFNHQLVRDVYESVPLYIHSTDMYIQHFFVIRPIDLLFMGIKAQVFEKKLIRNIMKDFDRRDLQVLIIQLLCDEQGVYVMDVALTQCINSYSQKCLDSGSYINFQHHRQQFFREITLNKAKKIPLKESDPELYGRQEISQSQQKKLCGLLFELCSQQSKKEDPYKNTYFQEINSITNSILCYLSRVLRYIWMLQLTQMPSKAIHLVQMLHPLLKLISSLFDKQYIQRAKNEFMNDCTKTKQKIRRIQTFIPFQPQRATQDKENSLQSCVQLIQKLTYFINKIIQLIIMSSQTKLTIKRKFHFCIGLQPQFFQQFIFNFLIIDSTQPLKDLLGFKKSFPLFIGKNLEKSLRIYNQTKALNKKEVYQTAKEHQNLPDYLLAYLKNEKGVKSSEIKEIKDKKQGMIKIPHDSGSKQMIQQLLGRVTQQYLSYIQRKSFLFLTKKELQIYKKSKKMGQDRFYFTTTREIFELERIIDMQQILLEEYSHQKKNQDNFVVDQLKNGLISMKKINQIVDTMEDPKMRIVCLYLFTDQETKQKIAELTKQFKNIFQNCFAIFNSQNGQETSFNISKYIGLWKGKKSTWKSLWKTLIFIIGKARKYINLQLLVKILQNSLQATKIANKKNSQTSTQLQSLDLLLKYLKQTQSKTGLKIWIDQNQYPIIALALVKGGVSHEALIDIYMKQLSQHSHTQKKIAFIDLRFILHSWLNLYCLIFQFESNSQRIIDFVDYTKLLFKKLGNIEIQTLGKEHLVKMKELAKILVRMHSKAQQLSEEYLQQLQVV